MLEVLEDRRLLNATPIARNNSYFYTPIDDLLNRMIRMEQHGVPGGRAVAEKRVDLSYNALGQFLAIVRYSALAGTPSDEVATSTFSYDGAHRLIGPAHTRDGQPLVATYSWTYDNLSRILEMVHSDGTSSFSYDATDQLVGAEHSYQTDEAYRYDANGNRTGGGYVVGGNNQLLENGTYAYQYDADGNRTVREHLATGEWTECIYES